MDADPEPGPRQEMELLLGTLLTRARELLEENGGFYPFGGSITEPDGEMSLVTPRGEGAYPLTDRLAADVVAELRGHAAAGRLRASGVCADVLVRLPGAAESTDAVRVALEHRDSRPLVAYLPYRRTDGIPRYEEMLATPGEPAVFAG